MHNYRAALPSNFSPSSNTNHLVGLQTSEKERENVSFLCVSFELQIAAQMSSAGVSIM